MNKFIIITEPILLKGPHIDFPPNSELFWDIKMKNGDYGENKTPNNKNRHTLFNGTTNIEIKQSSPGHNSTSNLCTGIFDFWKQIKLDTIFACPICDAI